MSVDANIDATCIARHRSADGYWFSRRGRRLFGWRAAVLTVDAASAVKLASAARSSYPNLVADIAVAIAGSAASGGWPRLKACSAPQCGQAFYDESESAAGRHCPAHAGSL
jgi:predicted RNA-binding Zn ribbon-like protein